MESPPPLACYLSQKSKKRVFPGTSSTFMEAEVVEISPPINGSSKSKSLKQKEVFYPEIIDVDMEDDSDDVMLVSKAADTSGKGKETYGNFSLCSGSGTNHVPADAGKSSEKNYATGSHFVVDVDDFGSDIFYGENEHMDMQYDDQYAILQSHFDHLDIPPGVEVPIPWLMGEDDNSNDMDPTMASTSNHSSSQMHLDPLSLLPGIDSPPSWTSESEQKNQKSVSGIGTVVGNQFQTADPQKSKSPLKRLFVDRTLAKKKPIVSRSPIYSRSKPMKDSLNHPAKMELLKSFRSRESSNGKWKSQGSQNTVQSSSVKPFVGIVDNVPKTTKHVGNGGLYDLGLHIETNIEGAQPGTVKFNPFWQDMPINTSGHSSIGTPFPSGFFDPSAPLPFVSDEMTFGPWFQYSGEIQKSATIAGSASNSSGSLKFEYGDPNEFLKKFDLFKKFDTVQDYSDHHYSRNGSSSKQPSKSWAKKIQEEWRILEKDLPETIFVRVYESRMDLLRAVIIGAEGTPYHDGLFFFDVFFPSNYPNVPPHVHYHSGGLRINPNLYNCGKVCLSLLNTWSGSQKEKWIPGLSTTLQVLVSIQGLILNAKPFFNEPGYANMNGTAKGEQSSLDYNENTFILSLKTMVYAIRRPPKHFEDFVAGHFYKRAHDILVACKAYADGAQVGCLVKGGVQDVDEGDKSCSWHFKDSLAAYIRNVVDAFASVGAKDCEKFLSLAHKTSRESSASKMTRNYY